MNIKRIFGSFVPTNPIISNMSNASHTTMYSIEQLQETIEQEIEIRSEKLSKLAPKDLYLPVNYALQMGGKRLRPVLLLMAYNLFEKNVSKVLPAAIAIEVFHNFTLLHDDIMDKAEVRRNRPTVHTRFGDNSAILSGDGMSFLSYQYLMECTSPCLPDVLKLFTQTALEVCEGQQYDMDFETRLDVSEDEYLEMIRLKTAVLLACSLKAGAVLANAPRQQADWLYDFGINLGLAFQLQDDLLDTFGDQDTFGKKIGGDIVANKKTFLLIKALENAGADKKTKLLHWIEKENFCPEEKINAVTTIYNQFNIKELAEKKVDFYFSKAMDILENLETENSRKQPLLQLASKMLTRKH